MITVEQMTPEIIHQTAQVYPVCERWAELASAWTREGFEKKWMFGHSVDQKERDHHQALGLCHHPVIYIVIKVIICVSGSL
jgi:hypothetical protein